MSERDLWKFSIRLVENSYEPKFRRWLEKAEKLQYSRIINTHNYVFSWLKLPFKATGIYFFLFLW